MDSTIIEKTGISALKTVLLETQVIDPKIKEDDKYPIWDGELLVYNDNKHSVDNFDVRVPIQIKCEVNNKLKKEIEKYSVKISHLKKYAEEGGVLFIKVVLNDKKNEKYFYANLLMKADIVILLESIGNKQTTKSIDLYEFTNGSQIVSKCLNFKIHRQLQMQIPTKASRKKLQKMGQIYTCGYINKIEDLVTKEHYAYAKTEADGYAYVGKFKTNILFRNKMTSISTQQKRYYDYVTEIIKDNAHYYEINENVIINGEKIIFDSFAKKDISLDRAIENLEFVYDLYKNKKIKIGDNKLTFLNYDDTSEEELKKNIKIVENNLNYLHCAKETLDMLNISTKKITVKTIIDIENEICKIRDIIKNKQKIKFEDETRNTFVLIDKMEHITFLVYFIRQDDGSYIGYDYLQCNEIIDDLKMKTNDKVIQLSRYYNLKADVLIGLNLDVKKMFEEIRSCTINNETVNYMCYLMMEFIKAYDITYNKEFLNIATKINKYLRKQREYYSETIYKINDYQMVKRLRNKLDDDIKTKIAIMKTKDDDRVVKMSCCLLLENYDEFMAIFKEIKKEERTIFREWAIFNLLPDKYIKKL